MDDLFITGVDRLIEGCKRDLASELEMNDTFWDLRCGTSLGTFSSGRGNMQRIV